MKYFIYQNNRNANKYLELHVSDCYHFYIRQYMEWAETGVRNYTGDGNLHRISKKTLIGIIEDYTLIKAWDKESEVLYANIY